MKIAFHLILLIKVLYKVLNQRIVVIDDNLKGLKIFKGSFPFLCLTLKCILYVYTLMAMLSIFNKTFRAVENLLVILTIYIMAVI